MRKIATLFKRDPDNMRVLLPEVNPACQWVMDSQDVVPTRKFDGTCTMLTDSGYWLARREIKPGGREPVNFIGVQVDPVTGKEVGWEPIEQSAFFKAFQLVTEKPTLPGTYELCGPKVNRNPEGFEVHVLVPHGDEVVDVPSPITFDAMREFLRDFPYEGIVFWHPDGVRKAKLKRRDFEGTDVG